MKISVYNGGSWIGYMIVHGVTTYTKVNRSVLRRIFKRFKGVYIY